MVTTSVADKPSRILATAETKYQPVTLTPAADTKFWLATRGISFLFSLHCPILGLSVISFQLYDGLVAAFAQAYTSLAGREDGKSVIWDLEWECVVGAFPPKPVFSEHI